jgi:hypothetical protein
MDDLERRRHRLDRARFLIRAELAIAFTLPVMAAFSHIAAPGFMFEPPPTLLGAIVPAIGSVGVLVGIVWMVRLSRPDAEPGDRSWRYRDF